MKNSVLVLISSFVILLTSAPLALASQNETKAPASFSREALFERAFKSLSFMLLMASQDLEFRKDLTDADWKMYNEVAGIADEITSLNWLRQNGLHEVKLSNAPKAEKGYVYFTQRNSFVKLIVEPDSNVRLRFSDDPKLFDLKNGKPIRTAVTGYTMNDDVFVNTRLINQADVEINLGLAFSILFHEFGNKMGKDKMIPDSIDKLASRLQRFVDSVTTVTETSSARVHVMKFRNAHFHKWMEPIFYGLYQGVNMPFQFNPLKVQDLQGTFILLENSSGFHDLTESFLKVYNKENVVKFEADPKYSWARFNWYLTDQVEIKETIRGRISVELNLNQQQLVIPFWKPGSVDAQSYQLFQRAYRGDAHDSRFFSRLWELDPSQPKIKIIRNQHAAFKTDSPENQVEPVSKSWRGDDLVLRYRITKVSEDSWPEIVLEFQGQMLRFRATQLEAKTQEFEFAIPRLKLANSGVIRVVSLELVSRKQNLTGLMPEMKTRLFLPQIDEIALEGKETKAQNTLKSVQVLESGAWTSLQSRRNQKPLVKGTLLRFVFSGTEALRSLSILQHYSQSTQVSSIVFPGTSSAKKVEGPINQDVQTAWLHFESSNLKQTFINGMLYVEVDIDSGVTTKDSSVMKIPTPFSFQSEKNHLPAFISEETTRYWIDSQRGIDSIAFATESLKSANIQLKKRLDFDKTTNGVLQCRSFFAE